MTAEDLAAREAERVLSHLPEEDRAWVLAHHAAERKAALKSGRLQGKVIDLAYWIGVVVVGFCILLMGVLQGGRADADCVAKVEEMEEKAETIRDRCIDRVLCECNRGTPGPQGAP